MKITILLENAKRDEKLRCNHGLSAFIEAHGKKILLDTGQDDNFVYNAKLLGADIKSVDIAVISHFHYDHAGGLAAFFAQNDKAKVFIGKEAFSEYYVSMDGRMEPFGLDKTRFDTGRFVFVDEEHRITDDIKVISKLGYTFNNPLNDKFYKKAGDGYIKDDFSHETALVISEDGNKVLLSGCFHSGVVNAAKRASQEGDKITHVLGGFHLSGSGSSRITPEYFEELADFLSANKIKCYTGHCTGDYYFEELANALPGFVFPIHTGSGYII